MNSGEIFILFKTFEKISLSIFRDNFILFKSKYDNNSTIFIL